MGGIAHALNIGFGQHLAVWPLPLTKRDAGPSLCHLVIYSDCYAPLAFQRGKAVANEVRKRCPDGKRPALLLTKCSDVPHIVLESESEYVAVINLPTFLSSNSTWDGYAARLSGMAPETLHHLTKLNRELQANDVREWVQGDPSRLIELQELLAEIEPKAGGVSAVGGSELRAALDVIRRLDAVDAEMVDVLCGFLEGFGTRENRLQVLRNLMSLPEGATDGGQVLAENIEARLDAIEADAIAMRDMLPTALETDMQKYIAARPWLISLDHAAIVPQALSPRGNVDFLVRRFDGVCDIVEMKGPGDAILVHDRTDRASAPHEYKIAPKLANAIAQAVAYLLLSRKDDGFHEVETNLKSRAYILIGRVAEMEKTDRKVFEEFRRSLHGIEIIGFDELAEMALKRIQNVRTCLSVQLSVEPTDQQEEGGQPS